MGITQDAGLVFSHIYDEDHWDGGSGVGSAPDATAPYRAVLAELLAGNDVRTVTDVGCGDWQLGSLVDWSAVEYRGLDVVPSVVQANAARFAGAGVSFELLDARLATPPTADLLLVKDVLQHWSNADVATFLASNLDRYRYCLITNDIASTHWDGDVNEDMLLGGWRTLDLEAAPFGHRAVWRGDFDVRGEWTKRMTLYASPMARSTAWFHRSSALTRLRAFGVRTAA